MRLTMAKKYQRPIPDYSSALPPKSPPLDVSEAHVLAILKKRPGRLFTAPEILTVLKENIDIWDNTAAVIWAATKLSDRGKCESADVEEGDHRIPGWRVTEPKKI